MGFIKDLCVRRIILKYDNELSTKSLEHAVIQACAGLEVIPQGPLEGDNMANGRVNMAVREVRNDSVDLFELPLHKTQACASQMAVRYSVGFPFCSASHEQIENWFKIEKRAN